jgi:hypothetical protein
MKDITVNIKITDIPEVMELFEDINEAISQAIYHLTDPYKAPELQRQLALESLNFILTRPQTDPPIR